MHELKAMMAGSVWEVCVEVGDKVEEGQDVVILESMKMEIPLASEVTGTVKEVRVSKDDFVNEDDVLIVID
ncbi:acetyl-CoA carboxylase biotin carboxyl carrier protein subunit [Oceanobacillus sp. Castelsardo]|uniref:acetyl-CoA carboxylase biotin carboxyl carrier protein subunit n=1 Tax=Oceanobacillus sp. Castelsardo TaxID=1851204 RepID=UPI000838FF6D|nr:acetyl-CoA carboxylase biotin carboxyl carrier protein subunit [Oceanobacillus sp. Castelsardo]